MSIDDGSADTELGNSFCIAAVAAVCTSLGWEHKSPIIPMIDAYYMRPPNSVPYGNSCKMESAKHSLYGNYGLVHVGSCSLTEAIIWLLEQLPYNDIPSRASRIAGMKSWQWKATSSLQLLEAARYFCSRLMTYSRQMSAIE